MVWLVPLLLLIPNIALDITEISYSLTDKLINLLVPAGVYLMLFAASRRTGATTLWFIPVMVLCAFQIVLLFLYGESIIAIDMFLNVVTTNVHEATELLRNLSAAIVVVCALYLPPIITATVLCVKGSRAGERTRKAALYCGLVLAAAGLICMLTAKDYHPTRRLFPVNVISNMFEALDRTRLTENYFDTSADYSFGSIDSSEDSTGVYVLVIGETSRADNWQLNGYQRPTNPRLSKRSGLLSFNKALSESNTTHKSVPLIMSALDACDFCDSIYQSKGIIDAFKEAGISTTFISNQQRNGALIDFFGEQADSVLFLTDDGCEHYDSELCNHLKDVLYQNEDRKVFVVLHTYGSHFNYKERYPDDYSYFTPDNGTEASAGNRDELMNAYDNAIRYTDAVIDGIVDILAKSNRRSAMVYLADHGEDIFDDSRERFLHASPTPTYWQIHVPMLVWVSDSYRAANPERYSTLLANTGKNVSSSRSAFHTLISLAGIATKDYNASADLSSVDYSEPTRVFLNDYNEAVPLKDSGLRKPDYDQLAQHRINF